MEEQRKNSYDPNEDIVDRMWKRSKNSINLVIVVCNILVFLAVTLTGGTESSRHMMDCGAAYAPLIESGEYYRLFTSMFLHFGIQHLINNMLLLFVPFGITWNAQLERSVIWSSIWAADSSEICARICMNCP